MRCTMDHEKTELTSYDGETTRIDNGGIQLFNQLTGHRMIVRNICEGSPFFVDQTHYEARHHRAEIRLVKDEVSLAFAKGLLLDSHFFTGDKVSWTIEFDRVPYGDKKDESRITLMLPPKDLEGIGEYIAMKDSLASLNSGLAAFN